VNCLLVPLANGTNPNGSCICRTPYVWNQTSMRCEPPVCPPSSYFDFSTATCRINCSAVANARGTYLNGSCICNTGYFWNNTGQKCQDRCTVLPYSNGQPALPNGSCTCNDSHYYYDTIFRVCRIQCWTISNINWFVYPQPVNYCICANGFIWNGTTYTCGPNCSLIANTAGFAPNQQCTCRTPYVWDSASLVCLVNCSQVANSLDILSLKSCRCMPTFVWNATTATCNKVCSLVNNSNGSAANGTCQCIAKYSYNVSSGTCVLNCSLINNTNLTGPSNSTTCSCANGYTWNQTSLSCSLNCSLINNTNNASAINGTCVCVSPYSWNASGLTCTRSIVCSGAYSYNATVGTCVVNCSALANTTNASAPTNTCVCASPYTWSATTQRCTPPACDSGSYWDPVQGICQINCTRIINTNKTFAVNNTCICVYPYSWNNLQELCLELFNSPIHRRLSTEEFHLQMCCTILLELY